MKGKTIQPETKEWYSREDCEFQDAELVATLQLIEQMQILDTLTYNYVTDPRSERRERREYLRNKALKEDRENKENIKELRLTTEKRGAAFIEFCKDNKTQDADIEVCDLCKRKPLSRMQKGKTWSKTAETYV
tara:strand:+ start:107 stop:505 length:399 start_codon:yes stop_codon:yes gene_type:complete